jgi:predicted TIM-barrel fold metal-dependent hydrolase
MLTHVPPSLTNIPGVSLAQRKSLGKYATLSGLLGYLRKKSVELGVVLPLVNFDVGLLQSTASVLRTCRRNPTRLIPFCCVDPRMPRAEERVADYLKRGCKGFGEHKVSLPVDHELSRRIYAVCNDFQIPLVIHFGSLLEHDYFNPGLSTFEEIASEYSEVTFIAHGPGWWKAISTNARQNEDYPSGRVVGNGLAIQLLRKCRNVHADLSGTSGLNALTRDRPFARHFLETFQDKIHFGSDYPFFLLDSMHDDAPVTTPFGLDDRHLNALRSLRLSTRTMRLITSENTLGMFDVT